MTRLPDGTTRLDLVRKGLGDGLQKKRGRLIVSITKLVEDPRNERKTYRNMEGMIASIKHFGVIEAITVTPLDGEGDRYQIITGHRRYRAAKAAGLEQVEVLIRDPEDALVRRQKSVISNVQREDVGPVEMAEALQSLMDEDERIKEQDDLAELIGKDKAWVSGMLRILTLPAALQRKVGTSQLAVSYDTMIRIARLDDHAQQERLIDALLSGATAREIRDHIDNVKQAKGEGKRPDAPKPKRVIQTDSKATVIVQSLTSSTLTDDRVVNALKDAIQQVRRS
jgi:ParB family chromosome partitioning protein